MTLASSGPKNQRPQRSYGETHYALVTGVDAGVQIAIKAGILCSVTVGVAGTLLTLHDAVVGDALSDATTIMIIDTASIVDPAKFHGPPIAFSKGLVAVTTGAGTKLTIGFHGLATIATKTYPITQGTASS